jgi:hypothetical protein
MGWNELTPIHGSPRSANITGRIDQRGHLWLGIGAGLVPQLGWSKGMRVKLEIGDGDDAGKLRMTPAEKIGFKLIQAGSGSDSLRVQFKTPANFIASSPGKVLNFTISSHSNGDKSVEVAIPHTWLRATK